MKKVELGIVSHGTMRNEDLIPAFRKLLEELDENNEYSRILSYCKGIEESGNYNTLIAENVLDELIDTLDDFAPEYCYFGALKGDGSDFGYWVSVSRVEQAIDDDEAIEVSDLSDVPDGFSGNVIVNNYRGTMALYESVIEYREVWAIV